MKLLLPLLLLVTLAGCVTDGVGSVQGGDCRVFSPPTYAIRGATQHDQDWIDPTIESGVGGCKWARPAPRPAEWDAAVKSAPRKKHVVTMAKVHKWWPGALPVLSSPPVTPAVEIPVQAVVLPAPRSAIDELLHPEAGQ